MPKSKVSTVVQVGQTNLVDAGAMGAIAGFTGQYMNRMAAAGKVPWHGVKNGVRVYRRFSPSEVLAALAHGVGAMEENGSASRVMKVVVRAGRKEPRAKAC
jgi:hypothetical protein